MRNQGEASKVARLAYPFRCCVICGLQIEGLTIAHLDHNSSNNDPDNLAWMCWTHHWMYDVDFYPVEAVKRIRDRWQKTKGISNRIGGTDAAKQAGVTRRRKAAARQAAKTRAERRATSLI
jgi:hypothetical protein